MKRSEMHNILGAGFKVGYNVNSPITDYGIAEFEHYADYVGDPVFYHPKLNIIRVWAQFKVLMPENYGWILVGGL